ncbi:hypothetical protein BWI15_31265 [Kribbella sp. ALI-6-A]|uniref:hypothetical protein n=1 Tax=Kribbella sp. ALI-6-A TaxID=1933817 RepID=UPI00097BEC2D|nr:hypothetical protein [Kribbella sp. ALI-6-A]ONI67587.1 hypothetical protein BWI15_31265 [Kribbella sp. ALI-6-A]
MRVTVVRAAFYLAVISAAAVVWGSIGWVAGSATPKSAYQVGYGDQNDDCSENTLYLNKFQGSQMACTVKLATPSPWLAAKGGAVGPFKEADVNLIVSKATALAADGSLDESDRTQIEAIVDDLRRSHGERTGPRSPSQAREGRLYVAIATPLLIGSLLLLTALGIHSRRARQRR